MPKARLTDRRSLPPCPDPGNYILVQTKEGSFWRRKRGTVKPAALNRSFAKNAAATAISSPAASRVARRLAGFTKELNTGRLTSRLCGKFMKTYHEKGRIDFSLLKGFELQPAHPLDRILVTNYTVKQQEAGIQIQVPVDKTAVRQHNRLVTDFYFEAILLYGDAAADRALDVSYAVSPPYHFAGAVFTDCVLSLALPEKGLPWMLLLKVSCLEGKELAYHARHYGMKVVEVGG